MTNCFPMEFVDLTKVHPFEDAFDDGDHTGWTGGTWSTTGEVLTNPNMTAYHWIRKATTDEDYAIWWSVRENDDVDANRRTYVYLRDDTAAGDYLQLRQSAGSIVLYEYVSGSGTQLDSATVTIDKDVWYDYYAIVDGTDVTVYRGERGGAMEEVLSTTSADTTMATTRIQLYVAIDSEYSYDNFRMVSDDLDSTTTYAYNNANELTTMTQPDGSDIDFTYDLWGRMTKKKLGTTYEATYEYRYAHKLIDVTTDWPGEEDVDYDYGADSKRRERTVDSVTTKYNWSGLTVINEENGSGTLTKSLVGRTLAEVDGSSPSTGDYVYHTHDLLGSARRLRDQSKNSSGAFEFTPFGSPYSVVGTPPMYAFAHLALDPATGMHYAPYRYYAPRTHRWMTRDPFDMLDGPNMYFYVLDNPVGYVDPLGGPAVIAIPPLTAAVICVGGFLVMSYLVMQNSKNNPWGGNRYGPRGYRGQEEPVDSDFVPIDVPLNIHQPWNPFNSGKGPKKDKGLFEILAEIVGTIKDLFL